MELLLSEWYDSQKKPNGNFRKSLRERLDKTNPRRKLAKDETTKLAKLEGFMVELLRTFECVDYSRSEKIKLRGLRFGF